MNMISDEVKNERKLLVEALLNHLKNEIKVDAEGEVALSNYLTNEVVEIEAAKALVVGLREDKNQLESRQIICVELVRGVNSRALLLPDDLHEWYSLGVMRLGQLSM